MDRRPRRSSTSIYLTNIHTWRVCRMYVCVCEVTHPPPFTMFVRLNVGSARYKSDAVHRRMSSGKSDTYATTICARVDEDWMYVCQRSSPLSRKQTLDSVKLCWCGVVIDEAPGCVYALTHSLTLLISRMTWSSPAVSLLEMLAVSTAVNTSPRNMPMTVSSLPRHVVGAKSP